MDLDKLKFPKTNRPTQDGWLVSPPTEPDTLWWFSGWRSLQAKKWSQKTELVLVSVRKTGGGTIMYVADGAFIALNSDRPIGLWKKVEEFVLPSPEFFETYGE
jgi:hypothetical protein